VTTLAPDPRPRRALPVADRWLALGLTGLTLLSRLPFQARRLPTWDAVQFALALTDYDIVRHQPHPPGYILFVAAARGLARLAGDGTRALTWLAVLASAFTVFLVYRLAWRLYDRATAVVAALILATSPLFWFYGEVPLSYAAEAALATGVASLAWALADGRQRTLVASAVVLGLAGGVRQSILVVLFPLWLGRAWVGFRRWRPLLGAVAVLAGTVLAWLLPMLWLTGGVEPYVAASAELYTSTVRATTILDPSGGWRWNVIRLAEASLLGLGLFLPVLLARVLGRVGRRLRGRLRIDGWAQFFAGWIVPPLAVYAFVHLGQHGYLLTVLPALAILVARPIAAALGRDPSDAVAAPGTGATPGMAERPAPSAVTRAAASGPASGRAIPMSWTAARHAAVATGLAVVCGLHVAFFTLAGPVDVPFPPPMAPWRGGLEARARAFYQFALWTETAPGLREREAVIDAYVEAIRAGFDPSDTVLVTEIGNGRSYPWFRHVMYYLPAFRVYHLWLGGDSPGYLTAPGTGPPIAVEESQVSLPASTRWLVWVVDYWNPEAPRPPGLVARPLAYGRWLYVLPVGRRPVQYAGYEIGRFTAVARPPRGDAAPGSPTAGPSRSRTGA
jgi:Dolichyl-phosphate-mannose-protein mannosyltransferase